MEEGWIVRCVERAVGVILVVLWMVFAVSMLPARGIGEEPEADPPAEAEQNAADAESPPEEQESPPEERESPPEEQAGESATESDSQTVSAAAEDDDPEESPSEPKAPDPDDDPADERADPDVPDDAPDEPAEKPPGDDTDKPAEEPADDADDPDKHDDEDDPDEPEDALDVIVIDELLFDIGRAPIDYDWPAGARELEVRLEADRRLLAELRKSIPRDRHDVELYLRRIRELAAISDPVSLVPLANNVIRQAPALYEWLEREYDDPEEQMRDYYIGGSWAFHRRFETFRKAVLLTVIKRLDVVSELLEGDQE